MNPKTDAQPKPRLALAIATACGAGYLPKAPGTFGSLVGVLLTVFALQASRMPVPDTGDFRYGFASEFYPRSYFLLIQCAFVLVVSLLGLWAAGQVAVYLEKKDPQTVVIDEVSGQLITYLGLVSASVVFTVNWQSLLAGFLLFRLFDIWKPFPIRRLESLPGGLGIMADDWLAGVYAALLLALARHFGF